MQSTLKEILLISYWDIVRLKNQKVFLAMRIAWFTIQVLVFARVITHIVSQAVLQATGGVDYYYFYLLGIYTSLLYSTSISRGYIIAEEFDDGIVEYHLSLPVRRSVFAIGRVIGCAVSSILFTFPMMVLIFLIIGILDLKLILLSTLSAVLFSTGVVSFVLLLVFGIKSTDLTDILIGAIDALLIRLSTVFYPLSFIMATGIAPYYYVALANPITHFSDFLRILVFPEYYLVAGHGSLASILFLLGFAFGLLIIAIEYYEKRLEGGGWK